MPASKADRLVQAHSSKMRVFRENGFVKFRLGNWDRTRATLRHVWAVYSKPTPENSREMLMLMLSCFTVALVTSIFLFSWMVKSLSYGPAASSTVSCTYGVLAFFLLFLIHPFRCVFTMVLPALGTKQGRKLILSTSIMVLLLNVVPNIATNVGAVSHVLKCTAGGLLESLINSSEVVNKAKAEVINKVSHVKDGSFTSSFRNFDHYMDNDVSKVRERFTVVSQNIERDFSYIKHILKEVKLGTSRILAVFFVIYMFVESVNYLKSYLTDLKFDNKYFPGQLAEMASDNGIQVLPVHIKNVNQSKRFTISRQELLKCVPQIMAVSLYFAVTMFVIVLDYIVYDLVSVNTPWVLEIPPAFINTRVEYKVQVCLPSLCILLNSCSVNVLVNFEEDYPWKLSTTSEHCTLELSKPDKGVAILVGSLYLLAYTMVFFEVYATRTRRAVSASFFKWQEVKRIEFLRRKQLAKQEQDSIFFIDSHELM